jgi:serine/threonine protein kinase
MDTAPSNHPTVETLREYGLGRLPDDAVAVITRHLESCASCRQVVAEMASDSFLARLSDLHIRPEPHLSAGPALGDSPASERGPSALERPSASALPPELVDHPAYEFLGELGRRGLGSVYLAFNKLLGRKEVLKVVSRELMDRRGVLDRFLREIRSAAQLHHSNIVSAYSAFRAGESIVFAMEYVEGQDLTSYVKARGPLPVAHATYFIAQAALGLQYAHEKGLVHRDIKPSNLILAREGRRAVVKVLDFGLAKATSEGPLDKSLTHEGQMLGTPDYIAPEQSLDATKADIRADIYSLGCTLYYLLSGGPPFGGASLHEVLQAHQSMDAKPLNLLRPEVPVELAALVAKMMAKDPAWRFQTPGEVAQALAPFFKNGPWSAGDSASAAGRHAQWASEVSAVEPSHRPAATRQAGDGNNPYDRSQSARESGGAFEPPGDPKPPTALYDENVQFTVFRPRVVEPSRWYPMLAFAHLAERRPDSPKDEPDPIERVRRQAARILGKRSHEYRNTTTDSRHAVPQAGEITFLPSIPGIEFDPERRVFRWLTDEHGEEFQLRASPELHGQTARGRLSVYLGMILLAEVDLAISVDRNPAPPPQSQPAQEDSARPYRRIFASYSHADAEVVRQFDRYVQALGDRYLIDVRDLRAGEIWNKRLARLINEADVFQLFWSSRSMVSPHVEREWRYALRVRPKTGFSIPRPPEADDRVGQVDEGQVVASINFKANLQATK